MSLFRFLLFGKKQTHGPRFCLCPHSSEVRLPKSVVCRQRWFADDKSHADSVKDVHVRWLCSCLSLSLSHYHDGWFLCWSPLGLSFPGSLMVQYRWSGNLATVLLLCILSKTSIKSSCLETRSLNLIMSACLCWYLSAHHQLDSSQWPCTETSLKDLQRIPG